MIHATANKYEHKIKSKLLYPKSKNNIHRSSPRKSFSNTNIAQLYPHVGTPQLTEDISPPPPTYTLHNTPLINPSTRHSQSPTISSPPCIQNPLTYDDTNFDTCSYIPPIHKVWLSTKIYPSFPPPA